MNYHRTVADPVYVAERRRLVNEAGRESQDELKAWDAYFASLSFLENSDEGAEDHSDRSVCCRGLDVSTGGVDRDVSGAQPQFERSSSLSLASLTPPEL